MSSTPSPPVPESIENLEKDAPRKEIVYYALGGVEPSLSGHFYGLLNVLMIVTLGMNPVLLGLILAIRTFWDGFIDPFIAQKSDQWNGRWGRRRPFIFVGGVLRPILLVLIFLFFPQNGTMKTNAEFAAERTAREQAKLAAASPAAPPVEASPIDTDRPAAEAAPATTPAPSPTPAPPAPKKEKPGMWASIQAGIAAFNSAENSYHREITLYLLIACLLFATISSINDCAYYALGIELCPSYDGRTRVVTYRSVVQKASGLLAPWVAPFCFLPLFTNVVQGLTWFGILCCVIGIPCTILLCLKARERRVIASAKSDGPGFLRSIWLTARNVHFLKILFLFVFLGQINGIFAQIGTFLTIYWVFQGDPLAGTTLSAYTGTIGTVLAFASLPLVNWACRTVQKHRTLRYAVLWMAVGTALKWVLVTPEAPYLQLLLPLFFSVGISSVYVVLPSLMADVTDIDELENGVRREGMFGAVMSFLTKLLGTLQPLIAGIVLVLSGFDAAAGANQPDEVIYRMRLMFSLIPAGLLLLALIALWRYPLTREYMAEVKAKLQERRAAAAAA